MAAPKVRLDSTVADLYRDTGIQGPFIATTHPVFAHLDLHPNFPRETIYPEDEEPVTYGTDEKEKAELRMMFLGLKSVKRYFALGKMDVILFTPAVEDVKRTFNQLPVEQRPNPCFIDLDKDDVADKLRQYSKGRKLLYWSPQGWMRELDCLIDPNMAYEINSKQYLITSGMRTPRSEMIDLLPDQLQNSVLATRDLPFVVKLPLATSGYGTWLVTTETRRQTMLAAIAKFMARGGTRVMVSEYIKIVQDLSAHLVVGALGNKRDRNDPLFVAVTIQNLTDSGHWTGGTIDYSAQAPLKKLLENTVRESTKLLPDSFAGWVGLDIVVDEEGNQWVVDLNPRFTGSVPICVLSNHFFQERGLPHAEFGHLPYEGETTDLYTLLSSEIASGEVVINAATSVGGTKNLADLVWGAKTRHDVREMRLSIERKLSRK